MQTRTLETLENKGTEIIYNKTGKVVGAIAGSYVGGFVIVTPTGVAHLPFELIDNYSVKVA